MAPRTMDGTILFLTAVADWGEQRNVEHRIWRTDAPAAGNWATPIHDWRVTVTLRDSEGLFQGSIHAFHPGGAEAEEHFARRVAAALDRCCAEARRKRITSYAKADPRRVRQSAAAEARLS